MAIPTYTERLMACLADGRAWGVEELLRAIVPAVNAKGFVISDPMTKMPYLVVALKASIASGAVKVIRTPGEKRLWAGHLYCAAHSACASEGSAAAKEV